MQCCTVLHDCLQTSRIIFSMDTNRFSTVNFVSCICILKGKADEESLPFTKSMCRNAMLFQNISLKK